MRLALQELYSPPVVNGCYIFVKEEKEPFFCPPHECTVPQDTVSVVLRLFMLWHPTFYDGMLAEFTMAAAELCDHLEALEE